MKVLLDTCCILWAVADPERLSKTATVLLQDADADVLISRKKELPRAEIVRQQKLMSAVLPNLADVVVIDVNKSDPATVAGAIYQTFSGAKSK